MPCSTIRPSWITTTRSAPVIVERRWAMTNEVLPLNSRASARWITCSVCVSTDEVASSRIRMRGSARRARAKEMSCRCPTESMTPPSSTGV